MLWKIHSSFLQACIMEHLLGPHLNSNWVMINFLKELYLTGFPLGFRARIARETWRRWGASHRCWKSSHCCPPAIPTFFR